MPRVIPWPAGGVSEALPSSLSCGSTACTLKLDTVYGVPPVYIREGGSIPVTAAFDHVLGLPVVLLGFAQPSCNAHAPNEWMSDEMFVRGMRAIATLWEEMGK